MPMNPTRREFMAAGAALLMGREAAYTGRLITWDEMVKSDQDLSPPKYEFGPLPLRPVPMPGKSN